MPSSFPPDDRAGPTHHKSLAAIAGGIVGGVLLAFVLLASCIWYRRRSDKTHMVIPFSAGGHTEDKDTTANTPAQSEISVAPLTKGTYHEDAFCSTGREPSEASDDSLRQNIRNLWEQMEALRAEHGLAVSTAATSGVTGDSTSSSSLHREFQILRKAIEQLRTEQSPVASSASPATTDLLREMAFLRAEMDEMRLQQEIIQGPLPSYSPPSQPLPGFPGQTYTP